MISESPHRLSRKPFGLDQLPICALSIKNLVLVATLMLPFGASCAAQHPNLPTVTGPLDQGLHFPGMAGKVGDKDPTAIKLIQSYLSVTVAGGAEGLCASGTIALGGKGGASFPAALALDGAGRSRLDMTTPAGQRSIRMSGAVGGVIQENGSRTKFPPSVSRAGLFPTPGLLRKALNDPEATLHDDGELLLGGKTYRAVSYGRPLLPGRPSTTLVPPAVTQLLFDSSTHLLMKAADSVVLSETSRSKHLRVITFSGYQQRGDVEVPMLLSESRDGQPSWDLTLTEIQAGCSRPSSFFSLEEGAR